MSCCFMMNASLELTLFSYRPISYLFCFFIRPEENIYIKESLMSDVGMEPNIGIL